MSFFGRVANLVRGTARTLSRDARAEAAERAAALDAELGALRPSSAAPPRPAAAPASPAPTEREPDGSVKRRL